MGAVKSWHLAFAIEAGAALMPRGWVPRDAGTYVNLDDDALVIMTEWSGDDRATMAGGIVPLGRTVGVRAHPNPLILRTMRVCCADCACTRIVLARRRTWHQACVAPTIPSRAASSCATARRTVAGP